MRSPVNVRRFRAPWILVLALLAALPLPAKDAKPDPAKEKQVLQAVEAWKRAVIAKDRAALEEVFHPDLAYGHTTGEVLGKAESIDRVVNSPNSYESIEYHPASIRIYGKVAVVVTKIDFHLVKQETRTVAALSGIDVWISGAHGWQLLARQITRPPQPQP